MNAFICRHCGKKILDYSTGKLAECEHFPFEMASNFANKLDKEKDAYFGSLSADIRKRVSKAKERKGI